MPLLCVIPARIGSTRLPHKPLQLVSGAPVIARTVSNVLAWGLDATVVVAADDVRILEAVRHLPVQGVLTRAEHTSGTARAAEVVTGWTLGDHDIIVNVQGDEPFMPRAAVTGAVDQVLGGADIGTAAQPLAFEDQRNPHRVKVEVDARGRALRFYRTPSAPACSRRDAAFLHVGVYAFRPSALRRWMTLPPTHEETADRLEQLRPLHHGMTIGVAILRDPVPHGIDTEADLRHAEALL